MNDTDNTLKLRVELEDGETVLLNLFTDFQDLTETEAALVGQLVDLTQETAERAVAAFVVVRAVRGLNISLDGLNSLVDTVNGLLLGEIEPEVSTDGL